MLVFNTAFDGKQRAGARFRPETPNPSQPRNGMHPTRAHFGWRKRAVAHLEPRDMNNAAAQLHRYRSRCLDLPDRSHFAAQIGGVSKIMAVCDRKRFELDELAALAAFPFNLGVRTGRWLARPARNLVRPG